MDMGCSAISVQLLPTYNFFVIETLCFRTHNIYLVLANTAVKYVFVKVLFSIIIVLILASSGVYFANMNEDDKPCIEDWYAQTQGLFQQAGSMFSFSFDDSAEKTDEESLDLKLDALLPDSRVDVEYQPILSNDADNKIQDTALLPNMFDKKQGPSTEIKGQVHKDENDNIIGAEVQVAIPTDIN